MNVIRVTRTFLKYLNLIRERAGVPQYGTGIDSNGFNKIPLNGQEEVRQAIYHERRVELCCENGIRYFDLRRWKKSGRSLGPANVWHEFQRNRIV